MSLGRTHRRRRDRQDAAETKSRNVVYKAKESARRDARMVQAVRSGTLPYSPAVMSWLSRKLDKPARRITSEDIKALRV
jgi:hypothetical protein